MKLLKVDREWCEYPIGTKAHAVTGGWWIRVENGWKWCTGDTFPTPGGDAVGACVQLPSGTMETQEKPMDKTNKTVTREELESFHGTINEVQFGLEKVDAQLRELFKKMEFIGDGYREWLGFMDLANLSLRHVICAVRLAHEALDNNPPKVGDVAPAETKEKPKHECGCAGCR